jgi:hypothetical protein
MILFTLLMFACGEPPDEDPNWDRSTAQSLQYIQDMYPEARVTHNCHPYLGLLNCDLRVWDKGRVYLAESIYCYPSRCSSISLTPITENRSE